MNKYIVTFDKSQEDIPTLVVARESLFDLAPGIDVLSVHTGDEAVRLWNQLSGKGKENNHKYDTKIVTHGRCMMCGKDLTEGLFFCKECEEKIKSNKGEK